jgi:hypothetical protein
VKKRFGFYPYASSFSAGKIRIEPISNITEVVRALTSSRRINNDWFYPPLIRDRLAVGLISPIKPKIPPQIYTRRYELPTTHVLRHSGTSSIERVNFLILCTGLLLGMRLLPEGWGHFSKTPVEKYKLIDLIVSDREVERCLLLFDEFWLHHTSGVRRMMFNAINIFQLAQSYEQKYEEVIFQYVALDSVYRLFVECGYISETTAKGKRRQILHSERPSLICKKLRIRLPQWAKKKRGKNANALSELRNDLFHQGMIDNKPVGFGSARSLGIVLSIKALNCRALLYLLGLRDPYISSPLTTRQMHGLRHETTGKEIRGRKRS